jgi:hypothetical protein
MAHWGAAVPKKSVESGLQAGNMKFSTFGETRTSVRQNYMYSCADKSLARPGMKQATATENFDVHIPCL